MKERLFDIYVGTDGLKYRWIGRMCLFNTLQYVEEFLYKSTGASITIDDAEGKELPDEI